VFERVTQAIDSMTGETHQVDPSRFNDPVALKTQWSMISKGGAGFGSHKLNNVGDDVLAFKLTWGVYFLSIAFLLIWIAGSLGFWFNGMREIAPYVILGIFGGIGVFIFLSSAKPIVFDKGKGLFIKGKLSKGESDEVGSAKTVKLEDIHALQVLARMQRHYDDKTRTYHTDMTYEMNLVLHDATRKSVLRHGNRGQMLDDAETIANFLGIPVWDATA